MSRDIEDARDIDEEARRSKERSILETLKLQNLALLAGGIAHDCNNMIGSILGNVSFALQELTPGSPGRDAALDIESAARRAGALTRMLLAYSGRARLAHASLDLNRLVEEMSDLMKTAIPDATRLRVGLDEGLPSMDADAAQMRQVILNVLTNACQSLPERAGVVTVTTARIDLDAAWLAGPEFDFNRTIDAGAYARLEVTDTGRGMAPKVAGRLVDPSANPEDAGSGLGLAATLAIVRAHRGAIRVRSEPDEGTTVTIVLPFSRRALTSNRPRIASPG